MTTFAALFVKRNDSVTERLYTGRVSALGLRSQSESSPAAQAPAARGGYPGGMPDGMEVCS